MVLYTTFGPIRIRLLERLAPRVTALVWGLALARGCSNAYKCAFYRWAHCFAHGCIVRAWADAQRVIRLILGGRSAAAVGSQPPTLRGARSCPA